MRGRTNVSGNGSLIVGGVEKQFVVAEGEKIEAGDWVSVKENANVEKLFQTGVQYQNDYVPYWNNSTNIGKFHEKDIIIVRGNIYGYYSLAVFDKNKFADSFILKKKYDGEQYRSEYALVGDYVIILFTPEGGGAVNASYYLYKLSYNADSDKIGLDYIGSYEFTATHPYADEYSNKIQVNGTDSFCIGKLDEEHIILSADCRYYDKGNQYKSILHLYKIENGELVYKDYKECEFYFNKVFYFGGCNYLCKPGSVLQIIVDYQNDKLGEYSISKATGASTFVDAQLYGDKIFILDKSSFYSYSCDQGTFLYNISISDLLMPSRDYGWKYANSFFIKDDMVYIFYKCEIDEGVGMNVLLNTYLFTAKCKIFPYFDLVGTKKIIKLYGSTSRYDYGAYIDAIIINGDETDLLFVNRDTNYFLYQLYGKIIDGEYTVGQSNIVYKYNGDNCSIGFSKELGNAGEAITVYVPQM